MLQFLASAHNRQRSLRFLKILQTRVQPPIKTRQVSFQSLVTGAGSRAGGAVVYESSQDMRAQGQIQATDNSTNISINGNGFFVVSDQVDNQPSAYTYTRNGSFSTDAQGYLINSEGYYLLGQATDDLGNVISTSSNDLNSLVPVDVNSISGTAQATAEVRFDMNLPADASIGDTFNNSIEIFDALGVSHQISITWAKTAANAWTATFTDPIQTGTATTSGVIDTDPATAGAQKTINVTFNGNGVGRDIYTSGSIL
jgi:flagellar hook protein FlgE